MADHCNLRRRSPYGQEEITSSGPALHSSTILSPSEVDFHLLHHNHQYLLDQLAKIYDLTGAHLHELALCNAPARKRRKTTHSPSMYSQVQADCPSHNTEKWPEGRQGHYRDSHGSAAQLQPAAQSSGFQYVANGLTTLRQVVCPSCLISWRDNTEDTAHQPLVDTSTSHYGIHKPYTTEEPLAAPLPLADGYLPTRLVSQITPAFVDEPHPAENFVPGYTDAVRGHGSVDDHVPSGPGFFVDPPTSTSFPINAAISTIPSVIPEHHQIDYQQEDVMHNDPRYMVFVENEAPSAYSMAPQPHLDPSQPAMQYESEASYTIPQSHMSENNPTMQTSNSSLVLLAPNQKAPAAKRGPFRDQRQREQTAQTRRIGCCIRCRMQRIRCRVNDNDAEGACLTCVRKSESKMWRLPCLRLKITEVKLFKPGQVPGKEWTKRWKEGVANEINGWESMEERLIHVSEGYANRSIELRVRRFKPQDGDKLHREWASRGSSKAKRVLQLPPYATVDLVEAERSYDTWIQHCVNDHDAFLGVLHKVLTQQSTSPDNHIKETYAMAWRISQSAETTPKERELLQNLLKLWLAIRLTTTSTFIVGEETLGIPRMPEDSYQHNRRPLPPVMGAQIDTILRSKIQTKLRRVALETMQKMAQKNQHTTWLTQYLAMFILLHNIALITNHDHGYAKKHNLKRRWAREEQVREYFFGAVTLLAYFHYCNKGNFPFTEGFRERDLSRFAQLDDTALGFVRRTKQWALQHAREWEDMRAKKHYEHGHYWLSQLYTFNWMPQTE